MTIKRLGGVPICMDMSELQLKFVRKNPNRGYGVPEELHFTSPPSPLLVIDLYVKEYQGTHHYEIWKNGLFHETYLELTRMGLIKKLDKLKYATATTLLRAKKIGKLLKNNETV